MRIFYGLFTISYTFIFDWRGPLHGALDRPRHGHYRYYCLTPTNSSTFDRRVAVQPFRKIRPAATVARLWHCPFHSLLGRSWHLGATFASLSVALPGESPHPAEAPSSAHLTATVFVLPALVGLTLGPAQGSVIGPQLHARTRSCDFGESLHRNPSTPLAGALAQVIDVEQGLSGQ